MAAVVIKAVEGVAVPSHDKLSGLSGNRSVNSTSVTSNAADEQKQLPCCLAVCFHLAMCVLGLPTYVRNLLGLCWKKRGKPCNRLLLLLIKRCHLHLPSLLKRQASCVPMTLRICEIWNQKPGKSKKKILQKRLKGFDALMRYFFQMYSCRCTPKMSWKH